MATSPRKSARLQGISTESSNEFNLQKALSEHQTLPIIKDRFRQIPLEVLENIFMHVDHEFVWHSLRKTCKSSRSIALSVRARARWLSRNHGPRRGNILFNLCQMGSICTPDIVKYYLHELNWIQGFPIQLLSCILESLNLLYGRLNKDLFSSQFQYCDLTRFHCLDKFADITSKHTARNGPVVMFIEALKTPAICQKFTSASTPPLNFDTYAVKILLDIITSFTIDPPLFEGRPGLSIDHRTEDLYFDFIETAYMVRFLGGHAQPPHGESKLPTALFDEFEKPKFLQDAQIREVGARIVQFFQDPNFDFVSEGLRNGFFALQLPFLVVWLPAIKPILVRLHWMDEQGMFAEEYCSIFFSNLVSECRQLYKLTLRGSGLVLGKILQGRAVIDEVCVRRFYLSHVRPFFERGMLQWSMETAFGFSEWDPCVAFMILRECERDGFLPDFRLAQVVAQFFVNKWNGPMNIYSVADLKWMERYDLLDDVKEEIDLDLNMTASALGLQSVTRLQTSRVPISSMAKRSALALRNKTAWPCWSKDPFDFAERDCLAQAFASDFMPNADVLIDRSLYRTQLQNPHFSLEKALPSITRLLVLKPSKGVSLIQICSRWPHLIDVVEETLSELELNPQRLPYGRGESLTTAIAFDTAGNQETSPGQPSDTTSLMSNVEIFARACAEERDERIWPSFLRKRPLAQYNVGWPGEISPLAEERWPDGSIAMPAALLDILPADSKGLRIILSHILLSKTETLTVAYARKGVQITPHHVLVLAQTGIAIPTVYCQQISDLPEVGNPSTGLNEPLSSRYDWIQVLNSMLPHEEVKLKIHRQLRREERKNFPKSPFHKSAQKLYDRLVAMRTVRTAR